MTKAKLIRLINKAKQSRDFVTVNTLIQTYSHLITPVVPEKIQVKSVFELFNEEEKLKFVTDITTVQVLSDMVAGYMADINAAILKYSEDFAVEMFGNIVHLGNEARNQMKHFYTNSSPTTQAEVSIFADQLQIMIDTQMKLKIPKIIKHGK